MPSALLGWLLDQKMGLLVFSPIYTVAILGVVRVCRERGIWRLLLAPFVYYASLLMVGFWVQRSVPPRYLVPLLPLGAILVACALREVSGRFFAVAVGMVLALSLLKWLEPRLISRSSVRSPRAEEPSRRSRC